MFEASSDELIIELIYKTLSNHGFAYYFLFILIQYFNHSHHIYLLI